MKISATPAEKFIEEEKDEDNKKTDEEDEDNFCIASVNINHGSSCVIIPHELAIQFNLNKKCKVILTPLPKHQGILIRKLVIR